VALNIKDAETERLAAEVAQLAGETKTRAVKVALEERKQRLALRGADAARRETLKRFLEEEVWPQVPGDVLDQPLSRADREAILGLGPEGV